MASREELFREQEINRLRRERAGISSDLASDLRETSNVIREQSRFLGLERTEKEEIRKITREINKIAQESYNISLSDLASKKSLAKLEGDREKLSKKITDSVKLSNSLSKEQNKAAKDLAITLGEQVDDIIRFQKELESTERIAKDLQGAVGVQAFAGIADFIKSIPGLSQFSRPFEDASDAIVKVAVNLEQQRRDLEFMFETGTGLNQQKIEELGIQKKLGGLAGKYGAAKARELGLDKEIVGQLQIGNQLRVQAFKITTQFGATALGTLVLANLLAANAAQAEFRREVGRSIPVLDTLNGRLTSTLDFVRVSTELTRQFGFNAQAIFNNETLGAASELTGLMGLTAEQAANFALLSQTTGTNLDQNLESLVDQVGAINVANKSAVTQRQIINDIGNVSSAIAISFEGNTLELARAAQNARILGLNLQQVDNIAEGLLNIESSIASEFEAEVISGQQLNLERARFFALTNDLNGLTQELASNQAAINEFSSGTRIEQEAIAGALGMSRDEMAQMIFQQRLQLRITDEQARATLGLNKADFQRLSAQESIAKSIEKIGSSLAIGLEPVLAFIAEHTDKILGLFTALSAISLVGLTTQLVRMAAAAVALAVTNPVYAAATIGGLIVSTALLSKLFTQAGDAVIPAGRGPIISTREGGLIQGTANDDVIMAPGIARGRNAGLSQADVTAIAKAVRDGASQAQINLDGGRVSNRLQPSLAVNTRKYSI
jgi:hypothetical protein